VPPKERGPTAEKNGLEKVEEDFSGSEKGRPGACTRKSGHSNHTTDDRGEVTLGKEVLKGRMKQKNLTIFTTHRYKIQSLTHQFPGDEKRKKEKRTHLLGKSSSPNSYGQPGKQEN